MARPGAGDIGQCPDEGIRAFSKHLNSSLAPLGKCSNKDIPTTGLGIDPEQGYFSLVSAIGYGRIISAAVGLDAVRESANVAAIALTVAINRRARMSDVSFGYEGGEVDSGLCGIQPPHLRVQKVRTQRSRFSGRRDRMERFIRRENLALLRKRLAESKDEAQRRVILRLLAEEEAREVVTPPKSST
jgi:hypothetical protein